MRLLRSHATGSGKLLDAVTARAAVLIRLNQILQGGSGPHPDILDALVEVLASDAVPCIHAQGAIGTGDLSTMGELALALMGELDFTDGSRHNLWQPHGGDALAILSSNAFTAALACTDLGMARELLAHQPLVAALSAAAMRGAREAFAEDVAEARPHDELTVTSARMRELLAGASYEPWASSVTRLDQVLMVEINAAPDPGRLRPSRRQHVAMAAGLGSHPRRAGAGHPHGHPRVARLACQQGPHRRGPGHHPQVPPRRQCVDRPPRGGGGDLQRPLRRTVRPGHAPQHLVRCLVLLSTGAALLRDLHLRLHDPRTDEGQRRQPLQNLVLNLFLLAGGIVGVWLIERMSRRKFTLWTFAILAVCLALVGLWAHSSVWLMMVPFVIYTFVMSAASNITQVYPPELFPTPLRASGVGFLNATSRIASAIGTFALPISIERWGVPVSMYWLAAVLAAGFAATYLWAPNTENKHLV